MTDRKTAMRYPGGDPENGPAEPHYVDTGVPVWEEDFNTAEGTAVRILMVMELHEISVHDLLDAYIDHHGIIGVGLITLRDDLTAAVNAHLK